MFNMFNTWKRWAKSEFFGIVLTVYKGYLLSTFYLRIFSKKKKNYLIKENILINY